jgi:hypothetical protein
MAVSRVEKGFETGESNSFFGSGGGSGAQETSIVHTGGASRRFTAVGSSVARLNETVSWANLGTEVYFGMAIYLVDGLYDVSHGQLRLMGWTDFDGSTQKVRGGLWMNSDDSIRIFRHVENSPGNNEQTTLINLGTQAIPEETWTTVEIYQKLSETDGDAVTTCWVNGAQVGSTTTHNIKASLATGDITRVRYGFDDATSNSGTIEIIIDRCYIDTYRKFLTKPYASVTVGSTYAA